MSEPKILLTGVNGQVGGDLFPLLQSFGTVIAPGRSDLDLADASAIRRFVRQTKPDWIVNPAAYTAVDKAEGEPELAYAINAEAPRALGIEAAALGIPILHFSTDYVFSGAGDKPWAESDPTGPLGVYGASKLAGEKALAESGASHLIFRTSWVYSSRGKNFLLTILRLAQQKETMRIVNDQHGSPTWSRDLASMILHVMQHVQTKAASNRTPPHEVIRTLPSVYHAAGVGYTTWFGFAQEFIRVAAAARPSVNWALLVPIPTSEYPTPARRPANSRLDCGLLKAVFGHSFPRWQDSTATVAAEAL